MTKRKGKPRRENGAGSVFRRADSRWCATVTMENGKRAARYAKTEDEARELLKDLRRRAEQGRLIGTDRQSLAQFLSQWLKDIEFQVRPHSWWVYNSRLRHVIDYCGKIPLNKLKTEDLQRCYTDLMRKENLSASTVHDVHVVTKLALKHAKRWRLIQENPADLVDAPRRNPSHAKTLEIEQLAQLLATTEKTPFYALWALLGTTGMRIGEALALTWPAVDLAGGRVKIEHTTTSPRAGGVIMQGPVKSEASRRTVPLSKTAVTALLTHKTMMKERQVNTGARYGQDVVFPNSKGGFMRTSVPAQALNRATQAAGLPSITPHSLRHTAASLLLEDGVNMRVLQEQLGHSDVRVTLGTYSHVSPRNKQDAADRMDAMITKASGE